MCVICISPKGIRQPYKDEFYDMWKTNPHGAGYMVARNGRVEIHKGFMKFNDFMDTIRIENFTKDDVVIYHFRISTQGGVNPNMCHPFPLTITSEGVNALDIGCQVGIVHNGIIPMTSNGNREYSDTALFIMHYLSKLIRDKEDIIDQDILDIIGELIRSKMVLLNANGDYSTIGNFSEIDGLMYSNTHHVYTKPTTTYKYYNYACK